MLLSFRRQAWSDYTYWFTTDWFTTDRKICKRIHTLIKDAQRSPFDGIGKPEAPKGNFSGFWSRRIDKEHRMVYAVTEEALIAVQLRHHY